MTTGTEQSAFPKNMNGGRIDYVEAVLSSNIVDASRKPYLLAKIAISQIHIPHFDTTQTALHTLSSTNEDGVLNPPLSDPLANEIGAYINLYAERQERISDDNLGALVLLAMAVDEGSRLSA